MTSYSVLRSAQRATVIATWPGPWFDHSANITTLGDSEQASYLASVLTRLSEDACGRTRFGYDADTLRGINARIPRSLAKSTGEPLLGIFLAPYRARDPRAWRG